MITFNVNGQHSRTSQLELLNNRQDRSLFDIIFILFKDIVLLQALTTFQPNFNYKCLAMCVYVEIYKKTFVFSNILSPVIIFIELTGVVYVSRFRNVTLFPVWEYSERRCSLEFSVHCGIFQWANIPVHWKAVSQTVDRILRRSHLQAAL